MTEPDKRKTKSSRSHISLSSGIANSHDACVKKVYAPKCRPWCRCAAAAAGPTFRVAGRRGWWCAGSDPPRRRSQPAFRIPGQTQQDELAIGMNCIIQSVVLEDGTLCALHALHKARGMRKTGRHPCMRRFCRRIEIVTAAGRDSIISIT